MIALILMMPLLCIYADLMGILGGAGRHWNAQANIGSPICQRDHQWP
jgi:ABC-type transporter Mla maintaining outer membrane lipid asymmetry permease subunit MlaE